MSEPPKKRSSRPPRTASSDRVPAVQAFRSKLESIQEGVLEDLAKLNEKLDEEIAKRKDPRRDGGSDPPEDHYEEKKP